MSHNQLAFEFGPQVVLRFGRPLLFCKQLAVDHIAKGIDENAGIGAAIVAERFIDLVPADRLVFHQHTLRLPARKVLQRLELDDIRDERVRSDLVADASFVKLR